MYIELHNITSHTVYSALHMHNIILKYAQVINPQPGRDLHEIVLLYVEEYKKYSKN